MEVVERQVNSVDRRTEEKISQSNITVNDQMIDEKMMKTETNALGLKVESKPHIDIQNNEKRTRSLIDLSHDEYEHFEEK